jgi:hypothetical protein
MNFLQRLIPDLGGFFAAFWPSRSSPVKSLPTEELTITYLISISEFDGGSASNGSARRGVIAELGIREGDLAGTVRLILSWRRAKVERLRRPYQASLVKTVHLHSFDDSPGQGRGRI